MSKSIILISFFIASMISGCATQPRDSTLVDGVRRKAPGTYSAFAAEGGFGSAIDEATTNALAQCRLDGNKKMSIITTAREFHRLSGLMYLYVFFKCE